MQRLFKVSAPSNIAFVKYWGKFGRQLPMNPSISMTLDKCRTNFEVQYSEGPLSVELEFEGARNEKFEARIKNFLESIEDVYPLAKSLSLKIKSENTFPHSAGIASSASAMSALGCALEHIKKLETSEYSLENASRLSRLASGSACRSLYPNYSVWGDSISMDNTTNDFGIEFSQFHKDFEKMCDSIVIISHAEKSVSSSAGHALMNGHAYREGRIAQANDNFRLCWQAMRDGDFETFGEIIENEALSLHSLMLSSTPSYILLEPLSLKLIQEIRFFRAKSKLPLYFTIDAGPNIHVIYPNSIEEQAKPFIDSFCSEHSLSVIHDNIGQGAKVEELS